VSQGPIRTMHLPALKADGSIDDAKPRHVVSKSATMARAHVGSRGSKRFSQTEERPSECSGTHHDPGWAVSVLH
jgi:hypothetical protein